MFELFFKMITDQEKYINIKKLKEGKFPPNFESRCGKKGYDIKSIIETLIKTDPEERMSSSQLLEKLEEDKFQELLN